MRVERLRWGKIACWALYDFANSPYSTIMTTLGFPLFFLEVVAPGRTGPLLWGLLYGMTEVTAGLLSPGLGALSDQFGRRKPFLIASSAAAITGTALCALVGPGGIGLALLFFGVANVGFACANVFYNSLLIEVAPRDRVDTVSGIGWGTGYLGGLLGLLLSLPLYRGGTSPDNLGNIHLSFLLVAGMFLLFSLPIYLMPEKGVAPSGGGGLRSAYTKVWATLKQIRAYKDLFRFLLANFFFNDGLNSVILFAGVYGREVLHLDLPRIFLLFAYLQVVAAAGAFALGWAADRFGSRRSLLWLLGGWMAVVVALASIQTFGHFIACATAAGLLLGPTQSIARGYLAKLAPADKEGEFFGFFALCGKLSSLFGPILFGAATTLTGQMRWGALSLLPLFALGFWFLKGVRETGGATERAHRSNG